jgi:hypothetical protein
MIRGLNALTGLLLTAVGLVVSLCTMTVDGWTVLALVGVCMCAWDLHLEERQANGH